LIDDFEVEDEDVVMKLFMQSLIDDARDWYRSLPQAIIGSWEEFKRVFREKYGEKTNPRFIINEFTNITKGHNELVSHFHTNFMKVMNKIS